jgi:CheY-like chemotaxis protein
MTGAPGQRENRRTPPMTVEPTILVIDDDLDTRASLFDLLEDGGYFVVTARNGLEALEMLRGGVRPAAMLIDYYMPLMDGEVFCGECDSSAELAGIPRVIVSANRAVRERAERCRARAFLAKPIREEELFGVLGKVAALQLR